MAESSSRTRFVADRLRESASVKMSLAGSGAAEIAGAVDMVAAAYRAGGKVVLCGNGGSAADAQHIAAELVGRFLLERRALPALALTTNTSSLTAIANDKNYEDVFRRQVEALVDGKDVVIGISTSGNSANVIKAMEEAKKKGARTIALTGRGGSKLAEAADLTITVPSDSTPRIQEAHITIGHIICELVEKEISETG